MSQSSEFSLPFWEALAEGRLLVPECAACGRRFFTPEPLCPHCGAATWRWTRSPGLGSVYSVSVVHQPVNDDHEVPFALAIADLDDGWTLLTHIVGCAPDAVRIGMRIRFDPDAARSRMLPLFRPAEPASPLFVRRQEQPGERVAQSVRKHCPVTGVDARPSW